MLINPADIDCRILIYSRKTKIDNLSTCEDQQNLLRAPKYYSWPDYGGPMDGPQGPKCLQSSLPASNTYAEMRWVYSTRLLQWYGHTMLIWLYSISLYFLRDPTAHEAQRFQITSGVSVHFPRHISLMSYSNLGGWSPKSDGSAFASGTLKVLRRSSKMLPANVLLFPQASSLKWRLTDTTPLRYTRRLSGLYSKQWTTSYLNVRATSDVSWRNFVHARKKMNRDMHITVEV